MTHVYLSTDEVGLVDLPVLFRLQGTGASNILLYILSPNSQIGASMNSPYTALDYGQRLKYVFSAFDSHNRGFFCANDLCRGLNLCCKLGFFVKNTHAAYMLFSELDTDASGRVNFRQFCIHFTKRTRDALAVRAKSATWFYTDSNCYCDPPGTSFRSIGGIKTPLKVFKPSTFGRDVSVIAAFDLAHIVTFGGGSSRHGDPGCQFISKIKLKRADLQDSKWSSMSTLQSLYACISISLHSLGIFPPKESVFIYIRAQNLSSF